MQRADAGIAAPGENQLRCAARAYELIVNQIRRHPDQRQIAPPCRMIFVPGGKRNEVCEAFQSYHIAVANHFLDRLFEWKNMRQLVIMPWREESVHTSVNAARRSACATATATGAPCP